MNKTAILNTAIAKEEEGIFVFESPLLPGCIGAADTEAEAWDHFEHHVEVAYTAYLQGRLEGMYSRPGRPPKNLASLTIRVQPQTRKNIARLAEKLQCSQGELIDYLLAFWAAKNELNPVKPRKSTGRKQRVRRTG